MKNVKNIRMWCCIEIIADIILSIICILLVQSLKWKILILVECLHGISHGLYSIFSDLQWKKCEKVAEIVYKIVTLVYQIFV